MNIRKLAMYMVETNPTSTGQPNNATQPQKTDMRTRIATWLDWHDITNYVINDDLSVDVHNGVHFTELGDIDTLPVKFGFIKGDFICAAGDLTSCMNFPYEVQGDCDVSGNKIESLVGLPKKVGTGPSGGGLDISYNPIKTLKGITRVINGDLIMRQIDATSLAGIHTMIDLINGKVFLNHTPITHNILGILEIRGVIGVSFTNLHVDKIINQYFDIVNPKDFFEIQGELFDNGFDNLADL